MIWEDMDSDLILLNRDANCEDDVFEILGGTFIKKGYSKESYVQALKDREADYPTGLDINGFGIAIPHTDSNHVIKETEGIMTLNKPVKFIQMGSEDIKVDVNVVMMLAIENPQQHIKKLQRILMIVQDESVLRKIYHAKTPQEVIECIKEKEKQIEIQEGGLYS
ncbi:MAG: PTS sugar transporter subunit IIA [Faecalicoccus sp.]|uniref:PTS sugar transporter subunit IIA n=1 Tax=Faecalicoccus sp. TaxID=1971758 RepID=UPI002A90FCC7|nr:PTS sugar transporter subunit IIA [Faecalicoccus sp.]MDY5233612.1 PTS sugar transporter subunit IIA [Faecalicoccus sp.]